MSKLAIKTSERRVFIVDRRHLRHSFFFNKVADLRPENLLKKRLWHNCFPVNFMKFLRTPFFIEHLWWLLL